MKARGYSLVEMMVVIGITSVLLAIGTLQFNAYLKRYRTEAQTRLIHAELLKTRLNALYQRRTARLKLYPGRFEVYSSGLDDSAGVAPVRTRTLEFPVTSSADGSDGSGYRIDFDAKGLAGNRCSICIQQADDAVAVDSVVVSASMVRVGKKDKGDECKAENITVR
jgi:prepilin-type N-terminal cleavage/methylation domain-containing protein